MMTDRDSERELIVTYLPFLKTLRATRTILIKIRDDVVITAIKHFVTIRKETVRPLISLFL